MKGLSERFGRATATRCRHARLLLRQRDPSVSRKISRPCKIEMEMAPDFQDPRDGAISRVTFEDSTSSSLCLQHHRLLVTYSRTTLRSPHRKSRSHASISVATLAPVPPSKVESTNTSAAQHAHSPSLKSTAYGLVRTALTSALRDTTLLHISHRQCRGEARYRYSRSTSSSVTCSSRQGYRSGSMTMSTFASRERSS